MIFEEDYRFADDMSEEQVRATRSAMTEMVTEPAACAPSFSEAGGKADVFIFFCLKKAELKKLTCVVT